MITIGISFLPPSNSALPVTRRPHRVLLLSLILLLGFAIRAVGIAATSFRGDEAWIGFLAFSFGHNGQRPELGTFSSTGLPMSPFHNDLFSIAFAFDPDPRFARLWMVGLYLVSMAVLYMMVRRYWSPRVGLAALLLYALMPRTVSTARTLWHPNLVVPFIIGFLATGLLSAEGKRWARWLHPIMLCCALQSHPTGALFAPLSLAFIAVDWHRTRRGERRRLLIDYTIGAVGAALLLLPWIIGLIHFWSANSTNRGHLGEASSLERIFGYLINAPALIYNKTPYLDYTYPPAFLYDFFRVVGVLTIAAAFYLIYKGIRQRRFPDVLIGSAYLGFPLLLAALPEPTYYHYMSAILPVVAIIEAAVLVGNERRLQAWRRLGIAAIALILALYTPLIANYLQQLNSRTTYTHDQTPSLAEMTRFRDQVVRPNYETIYMLDGFTDTEFTQAMAWLVLAAKSPSRVIWGDNFAVPVPAAGATYIGYADAAYIPELFGNRPSRLSIGGVYRAVDLPPNSGFEPTCRPQGPDRLGNGATILGYYVPAGSTQRPRPGTEWTIYLLWQGSKNTSDVQYQLFNHLVDAKGERYGQRDMPSLATDLWRDGELLVSRVTMAVSDKLPEGQLSLHVGMYTLPNVVNASVIDDDGNPIAAWVTIPVCQSLLVMR
jgi:hypothetical protein